MVEIRLSVWTIQRLAMVWHSMKENNYKAPEQLVSSAQLDGVIHFLIDQYENHRGPPSN